MEPKLPDEEEGHDGQTALSRPFKKRYILAISLLVSILVLCFAAGLKNWIGDSSLNQMRESELQALSLLKQQEFQLFNFINKSQLNSLLVNGNSSSRDLSCANCGGYSVLDQISLNRRIQGVLLGNGSQTNILRCDPRLSERRGRSIEWNPRSNKYLLAICVSGQMSNRLICLEKHMFFAAVLDRVLVIPSPNEFKKILDIEHINKCLGKKVAVTFDEFSEKKLHVDIILLCYFSSPQPCFLDEDHVNKLNKELGLTLSKVEAVWEEDVKEPKQKKVEDILAKFSSDDDVIAVGDVFFVDVEREWVMQPGGPIAHKCKTLIQPSRLILLTAQRFVQTFLGKDFVAIHFRNAKKPSCFYPIPQAAECINPVVQRANSRVIYLSSDAAESETSLLQSFMMVPLVQRPATSTSAEKWDALLYRNGLEGDPQVEAMLDKAICAFSTAFIGSHGSTFTEDILRLRKDWGSASLCDEYLCQGEVPRFIAQDE